MPERKKQEQHADYRHLEDMALKSAAQFFGDELLGLLGIRKKIRRVAPTELVYLEARQMYEDFTFEMENGEWYHFEFESDRILKSDLRRFREYEAATSRTFHVPVTTYVVCTARVKRPLTELKEGINTYRVRAVMLKGHDADQLFEKLSCKKRTSIKRRDLVLAAISPLMSGQMSLRERVLKALGYLREPCNKMPEDELDKLQSILYALAAKFLDDADLEKIKEAIMMTRLGQMLVDDGIKQGLKALTETCKELGLSYEQTVEKIRDRFGLSEEKSKEAVERYWK